MLLLAAAVVGLIIANSALGPYAATIEGFHLGFPAIGLDLSVGHWVKDGLLAIFFFIAAIELRHELRHGELNSARKALVPSAAAVGGVLVPAVIFLLIAREPDLISGWPIPTATDIAFALGVLALVGRGLPSGFRALLLALAVIDDLIAILIIAAFAVRRGAPPAVPRRASAPSPARARLWALPSPRRPCRCRTSRSGASCRAQHSRMPAWPGCTPCCHPSARWRPMINL